MNGKQKCEILKSIRREIAAKNDIQLDIPKCTHEGDCPGTCPRCEYEVRILERGLADRKKRGLKVAVAGISAGLVAVNASGCELADKILGRQLQGDMMPYDGGMQVEETLQGDIVELPGEIAVESTDGLLAPPEDDSVDVTTLEGEISPEDYELGGVLPAPEEIAGEDK